MQLVNYPIVCCNCKEETVIQVNLWNGEHKIIKNSEVKLGLWKMKSMVEGYKDIKGSDTMPTWDKAHAPRAMAAAKRILRFFSKLEDPVGVSIECLEDTAKQAKEQGWTWTIETVLKRADKWLADKQGVKS